MNEDADISEGIRVLDDRSDQVFRTGSGTAYQYAVTVVYGLYGDIGRTEFVHVSLSPVTHENPPLLKTIVLHTI